ncbi:MAG: virulence factor SrfB [Bacteroidales bacterium]|nr:virulence factor SrfB [Bacteroidales bacterium]
MHTLIADSGIQFIFGEPFTIDYNKPTQSQRFSVTVQDCVETRTSPLTGMTTTTRKFDLLNTDGNGDMRIVSQARSSGCLQKDRDEAEALDEIGVPMIDSGSANLALLQKVVSGNADEVYTVRSLNSLMIQEVGSDGSRRRYAGIDALIGKWLPVPMYTANDENSACKGPKGWCRMRIDEIRRTDENTRTLKIIWAFDTKTSGDYDQDLKPVFFDPNLTSQRMDICRRFEDVLDFLVSQAQTLSGGTELIPTSMGRYIAYLMQADVEKADSSYKVLVYYAYLLKLLQNIGQVPQVELHKDESAWHSVDLSLDMGNSRTCGILFEDGRFSNARMLELMNMSNPAPYRDSKSEAEFRKVEAFDMRFAFRRETYGGRDIMATCEQFEYKSLVRLGEEARQLIYNRETKRNSTEYDNYSSPKRFLWDDAPFYGHTTGGRDCWKTIMLPTDTQSTTDDRDKNNVYAVGVGEHFKEDGTYSEQQYIGGAEKHYSRQSTMTFALIEILQQAVMQINSETFRERWGDIGKRRCLRNIILTCPTSMAMEEQIVLRKAAENAVDCLVREGVIDGRVVPTVSPSSEDLKGNVVSMRTGNDAKTWIYDEATCGQMVFLWDQITNRYKGSTGSMFEHKGHERPELTKGEKMLTIGSIDIGAGTTDIMVCAYKRTGNTIEPKPLYYDSLYTAGDDIVRAIIEEVLIEGKDRQLAGVGGLRSSIEKRMESMSLDDIKAADYLTAYHIQIGRMEPLEGKMLSEAKRDLVTDMLNAFFGIDAAGMSEEKRILRKDFCTQVTQPLACFMLGCLTDKNRRKTQYSYREIFKKHEPSRRVLDGFAKHFGFRFEDLEWEYDPEEVGRCVSSVIEEPMRQLFEVVHHLQCDILTLSGRPASLSTLNELVYKYLPVNPSRVVDINTYRVSRLFPLALDSGYFCEPKSTVAVGAMIGFLASKGELDNLRIDFRTLANEMRESTARYIGRYDKDRRILREPVMEPKDTMLSVSVSSKEYLGCKRLRTEACQARPLYRIVNKSGKSVVNVDICRDLQGEGAEVLKIDGVTDNMGNNVNKDSVELHIQTLPDDGVVWQDSGVMSLATTHGAGVK